MNLPYTTYSEYLAGLFGPGKVQKISVNAGYGCPNRDGTIGRGGCTYCSNASFTPGYCLEGDSSVAAQIARGKEFFARKYPDMRYLAYFQSYTSTFTSRGDELQRMYEEALAQPGIVGLVIGTRPDCLPGNVLEVIGEFARRVPVIVELGAESSHDRTLRRVNRGHTWSRVEEAVATLRAAGARPGLHLIAGLPGEGEEEVLQTVERACALAIDTIKMHQLQIIKGTPLHKQWLAGESDTEEWDVERYMRLCVKIIKQVPRRIAIERFLASAPPGMVASPSWGMKNHEFTARLHRLLRP
ncbi:MAG: TIGR01212 family radical SAM protein [Muribaculaceae bacterium]|nr:TIGR01212 family radical SAM protein [Muribaculaceae bacterium]